MATLNDLRDTGISFDGGLDIIAPNGETVYRKETCELNSPSSILKYLMDKPVNSIYVGYDEGEDPFFCVCLSGEVMDDEDFVQSFRSLGKSL